MSRQPASWGPKATLFDSIYNSAKPRTILIVYNHNTLKQY